MAAAAAANMDLYYYATEIREFSSSTKNTHTTQEQMVRAIRAPHAIDVRACFAANNSYTTTTTN